MSLFRQNRLVWRYAVMKVIHNSLPFFAILAAVGSLFSFPVLILLATIGTGLIVDLAFFSALADERRLRREP